MNQTELLGNIRNRVKLEEYVVENTQGSDYPGTYEGVDDSWNFEEFKKNFKIEFKRCSDDRMELEFDMIGVDASVANSFRRILLAEVPTMAIEKVYVYNNTSVIQDEVLAHRLGLIPLKADPRLFKYKANPSAESHEDDTLEFELKVKTKLARNASKEDKNAYIDSKVMTGHMKWIPVGNQASKLKAEDVGPIFDNILIAKMNPGQELDIKLVAVKGIGKDHAKFSPVATAFYKLLTDIKLKQDFYDEEAEKLRDCFSPGVIQLVNDDQVAGRKKAVVANARIDTCSRQIFMHEEFKDKVEITKIRNHFIFSVESTGALTADTLVKEAIAILMRKIDTVHSGLNMNKKK